MSEPQRQPASMLNGMLMPLAKLDGGPVVLSMVPLGELPDRLRGAENDAFLPLFTSFEKLERARHLMHFDCAGALQIHDGAQFLESLPLTTSAGSRLRIIIDPSTFNGMSRHTEFFR